MHFPGINYIVPFTAYFIIVFFVRRLRAHVVWLKLGRYDRASFLLSIIVVVMSSGALILWTRCAHPDLSKKVSMVPQLSPFLFAAGGVGFAVSNSLAEELIFRGLVQSGFMISGIHWGAALLIQAVLFGLWHFNGVPDGVVGSLMVFAWGAVLGMIRHRTGGVLAPIVAHICADLTILCILISIIE
jgi:membrane protease YdiL (CAAX protease family)